MAEMKYLNTRVQLKYDSYTSWTTNNPTLLSGEIAIAKLVNDVAIPVDEQKNAPVLFKVGPGKFNDLPWASALAADVYSWAKETSLFVNGTETTTTTNGDKTYVGNAYTSAEWDSTLNNGKGGLKLVKGTQFATKAELDAALDAFGGDLDAITDNNTKYTFAIVSEGDHVGKLAVTEINYVNGTAEGAGETKYYDFVTPAELETILANYYTSAQVDALVAGKLHTEAEIKTLAANEINTLIGGVSNTDTIENITSLITYVNQNGAEIAQLTTDVGTANTNASNAVSTADAAAADAATAKSDAATAVSTANEAKEAATTAQNSASASAGAAASSAQAAAGSASAASQSATDAATAKGQAESAKGQAETAAQTATEKATAASNSATAAAGSEANAAASAQTATEKADAASQSTDAAATAQSKAEEAQAAAEAAQAAAEASNTSATAIANEAKAKAEAAVGTADEAKALAMGAPTREEVLNQNAAILAEAQKYADSLNHEDTKYTAAANGGLKLNENNEFAIDDSVTFVFCCGSSTELI